MKGTLVSSSAVVSLIVFCVHPCHIHHDSVKTFFLLFRLQQETRSKARGCHATRILPSAAKILYNFIQHLVIFFRTECLLRETLIIIMPHFGQSGFHVVCQNSSGKINYVCVGFLVVKHFVRRMGKFRVTLQRFCIGNQNITPIDRHLILW